MSLNCKDTSLVSKIMTIIISVQMFYKYKLNITLYKRDHYIMVWPTESSLKINCPIIIPTPFGPKFTIFISYAVIFSGRIKKLQRKFSCNFSLGLKKTVPLLHVRVYPQTLLDVFAKPLLSIPGLNGYLSAPNSISLTTNSERTKTNWRNIIIASNPINPMLLKMC